MRTIFVPIAALAGIALLGAPATAQPREEQALRGGAEAVRQATPMVEGSVDSALELDIGPLLDALHPYSPRGRRMTLRELGRRDDPDFDRKLRTSVRRGGARAAATLDAMATAAPSIRRSLRELEATIGTALMEAGRPLPPEAWAPPPPGPPPSDDEVPMPPEDEEDDGAPW